MLDYRSEKYYKWLISNVLEEYEDLLDEVVIEKLTGDLYNLLWEFLKEDE